MLGTHSFKYNVQDTVQMNPLQKWSKYLKELTPHDYRDFPYNIIHTMAVRLCDMRPFTLFMSYDFGLAEYRYYKWDSVFFYRFTLYNARHFIVRLIIGVIYYIHVY